MPIERNLQFSEEGRGEDNDNIDFPQAFLDPLSKKPLEHPVILISDGHSYEKSNIEEWLKQNTTSPVTGETLKTTAIVENRTLLDAINEFTKNKAKKSINKQKKLIKVTKNQEKLLKKKHEKEKKSSTNITNITNKTTVINDIKKNEDEEKIEIIKGGISHTFKNIESYLSLQIGIVGDSHVGKSSLIHYLSNDSAPVCNIEATIVMDYLPFHLKTYYKDYPVSIHIQDNGGSERFLNLTKQYIRQLHGVIMVCSLSQNENEQNSFENIKNFWYPFIKEYGRDNIIPFIVCNKYDMYNENQYSNLLTSIQEFANENNIYFCNASAQTGFNVKNIFNKLILQILQNQEIFEELVEQRIYQSVINNTVTRKYRKDSFMIDKEHTKKNAQRNEEKLLFG